MLRNVFTKTLWDARRSLPAWAIGLAAVSTMYAAFYPSVRKSGNAMLANYPQALREAFNLQDIASPAGYLSSSVFGVLVPLLTVLFAVAAGTRAIAGEEEAGTLDLLLAHPVSRTRVVVQRFAAIAVCLAVLAGAVLLALLVVSGPAELNIPLGNLAAMVTHLALLGLCFAAFALALGAATGRRALVIAASAVVGVVAYLGNTFAPQVEGLEWLREVSPFHYYSGGEPLKHGLQLADAGILLAVSLLLVASGTLAFNRRDIGV
ncbi:ABC transporter permease [Carbonactinospora thermoautotrophica]|uniref:ABC transporter permease n=1 Tax=Carbonactinospora thermoautotrophica TaxID=1469144 RepID=UPI00226FDA6E|nr:ABC transporter permease subunit [Carbonactinospora thermoautotrophica]MCX9193883.1 ABC transporter permease [Carbonactinospora thermoautotrophica]